MYYSVCSFVCRCLVFLLANVLSVLLRSRVSYNPFGTFKLLSSELWVLKSFQQYMYFLYVLCNSFNGGGNRRTRWKLATCRKSGTDNFIYNIRLYPMYFAMRRKPTHNCTIGDINWLHRQMCIALSHAGSIWAVQYIDWIIVSVIYGHWTKNLIHVVFNHERDRGHLKTIRPTLGSVLYRQLGSYFGPLILKYKHNIRTFSAYIKCICTLCETGKKSWTKTCSSICFYIWQQCTYIYQVANIVDKFK